MENTLIKTLNILINNIEKYQVCVCNTWSNELEISYSADDLRYLIIINDKAFHIKTNKFNDKIMMGSIVESSFTDSVIKSEVNLLVEKLKVECENYTINKFKSFANNENNNGIDD